MVFALVGCERLPQLIFFVLDQRLVLELEFELFVLSLLLQLLYDLLNFPLLQLNCLLNFRLR